LFFGQHEDPLLRCGTNPKRLDSRSTLVRRCGQALKEI
jgi:hypothetical protein